jgi:hypothetical protein
MRSVSWFFTVILNVVFHIVMQTIIMLFVKFYIGILSVVLLGIVLFMLSIIMLAVVLFFHNREGEKEWERERESK